MYDIDRSIIVLIPKQPFWSWLQNLPEIDLIGLELQDLQNNPNSYLITPCEQIDEVWDVIEKYVQEIFSAELANWSEAMETYPELNIDVFQKWFDVLLSTVVSDVIKTEIERERLPFYIGES
ncbi:VacJ [Neisseriaceae bacterium PsAf]|nr:VacJ [Neisseriaceae bacterium PsAf]MCV2503697.1 VacJ [Neisseriaceae bacterium]